MAKKSFLEFIRDQRDAVPPVVTVDLSGKTVVVTGANTGLGYEASKHFARMKPARLILACRSQERGEAALNTLKKETGFKDVELWLLDLGRFESVISFVEKLESDGGRLDIFVANAAIAPAPGQLNITEAGWEEALQVNNLSTSLLCLRLLPIMVRTARDYGTTPRIAVVSSDVHYWATLDQHLLDGDHPLRTFGSKEYCTKSVMGTRYVDTKLLNVLFTRALAARLSHLPVIVSTVNPGYCVSELRRGFSGVMAVIDCMMEKILAHTTEEGSRQLVFSVLGPAGEIGSKGSGKKEEVDALRGAYISNSKIAEPSDYVIGEKGQRAQEILWDDLINELTQVDSKVKDVVHEYLRKPSVKPARPLVNPSTSQ